MTEKTSISWNENASLTSTPSAVPRLLFTGGSGRVGRMIRRHWASSALRVDVVWQSRRYGYDFFWDPLSMPLPTSIGKVDCLIMFSGVTPASGQPLDDNAALAEAILAAAHATGIRRVLVASSSAVYGAPRNAEPITENAILRPLSAYGASKVAMEEKCARWRARGLDVCVLRIGNVVGADSLLLNGRHATEEAPVQIDQFLDRGCPVRSYIGPGSLAQVVITLAASRAALPEVLNVGAPKPVGMTDIADAAAIPRASVPAPTSAVQSFFLDVTRLCTLHHFDPVESTPEEMIRQWHCLRDSA